MKTQNGGPAKVIGVFLMVVAGVIAAMTFKFALHAFNRDDMGAILVSVFTAAFVVLLGLVGLGLTGGWARTLGALMLGPAFGLGYAAAILAPQLSSRNWGGHWGGWVVLFCFEVLLAGAALGAGYFALKFLVKGDAAQLQP